MDKSSWTVLATKALELNFKEIIIVIHSLLHSSELWPKCIAFKVASSEIGKGLVVVVQCTV